ncbi:MAG: hypothetical protein IK101_01665 [Oscillospiraceae bacterium]|nr:hypothetical protein [Oscillospiraceae bacterium]
MKKTIALLLAVVLFAAFAAGCAAKPSAGPADISSAEPAAEPTVEPSAVPSEQPSAEPSGEPAPECPLEDGEYKAIFKTDSSMFHVNEVYNDLGDLTVKDGKMTIHVTLASDGIVNLFCGLAEDAQKDGAELLEATVEKVTYDDGYTDDVHAFDIPVPYLDEEFDLALVGTKGKWYDHKVSVSLPAD